MKQRIVAVGLATVLVSVLVTATATAANERLPVFVIDESPRAGSVKLAKRFGLLRELGGRQVLNYTSDNAGRLPLDAAGNGPPSEEGNPSRIVKLPPAAELRKLRAPAATETTARFDRALRKLDLRPSFAKPRTRLSSLRVFNNAGARIADVNPDRQITYDMKLGGIALRGPGAKISATYDRTGKLAQMTYALPELKRGRSLQTIPVAQADALARALVAPCSDLQPQPLILNRELAYFTHAKSALPNAKLVYPSYVYRPTVGSGTHKADLKAFALPAVATGFSAAVTASAQGSHVSAEARVTGGRGPYTYSWSSCSTTLPVVESNRVEYDVAPRDRVPTPFTEELVLIVQDADGLLTMAKATADVTAAGAGRGILPRARGSLGARAAVAGTVDVGGSYVAASQGLTHTKKDVNDFVAYMKTKGATSQFVCGDACVYDSDFKDTSLGGNDANWTDNVDMFYYQGHGGPWGVTNNSGDGFAHATEIRWGDKDLEWAALDACSTLQWEADGKNVVERWGPSFQGMHLLLGYATATYDTPNEGWLFANYLMGNASTSPQRVRDAWINQAVETQGSDVLIAWLAPIGQNGVTSAADYFHNKGPVGPDIPNNQITGWTLYNWWA